MRKIIYIYDFEVFKYDWLVVFKNTETGEYTTLHNDNFKVKEFVYQKDIILAGFNNKWYDDWILQSILCGADNDIVKQHNDWIIDGNNPWGFPFIKGKRKEFDSFDIRDDLPISLSLKEIEGNMGLNIVESEIPFDIDRKLTDDELLKTFFYCKHDVNATDKLLKRRKSYFESKLTVGKLKGLPKTESIKYTNAKLAARYLEAKLVEREDEREYEYPGKLNKELIPKEIFDFFDKMKDESIPDEKLFKQKLKLEIDGCEYVYGFGGVHAGLNNYREETTKDREIVNWDVSSLYPNIMINYGYVSRNVPDPMVFKDVVDTRLKAKKSGDKVTSKSLKLVINTTYGASLNKFNNLYDPLMGRSVCITGQLVLTDLAMRLKKECSSLTIINFNTDGVMFSVDKVELNIAYKIYHDWQNHYNLELEEDKIKKVVQKDVNNYCMIDDNGKIKAKGGYVANYEMNKAVEKDPSALINNNSLNVVADAVVNNLLYNIPVKETIEKCNNILDFQIIAKTGRTYQKTFLGKDENKIEIQRVNRVYASKNKKTKTIYKYKVDDKGKERFDKIANLPLHCVIDNENKLTVEDIDKKFYINMAQKRVDDFLGIKKPKKGRKKKMATTKKSNFNEKLMQLQKVMGEFTWEKDGINRHQSYKYVTEKQYKNNFKKALQEVGLLWSMEETKHEFIGKISENMHLILVDFKGTLSDPETEEFKEYTFSGSGADTGDKALYKAYTGGLKYFLASNFLVAEDNDPENDGAEEKPKNVAPEKREEIKEGLIDKDGKASKMQINSLKKALKMYLL